MRKLISILLAVFLLTGSFASFAAPFPDLPADHWATEAVKVLAEKGLVEGYPNGTFRGQRAATRYEVAMVVARLLAYLEKRPQVTREDLNAIKRLVDEFKDELDAMGVRLKNVEDLLASLERRVAELERVKVSGGFITRYSTTMVNTCAGCVITPFQFNGTITNTTFGGNEAGLWNQVMVHNPDRENGWMSNVAGFDFDSAYSGLPTRRGSEVTQTGYLKVAAKLTDDYTANAVVGLYNNVGQGGNGYIYGSMAPTVQNPFQAGTAQPGQTTFGTGTNLSASIAQLAIVNPKQNINAVVGDWKPAYVSDFILKGMPSPFMYGDNYLPFYGAQAFGKLGGTFLSGLNYEVFAGRLSVFEVGGTSQTPSQTGVYQNIVGGGALGYSWNDVNNFFQRIGITGSFMQAQNDTATVSGGTVGGFNNPGLWASPINALTPGSLNGTGATPAANAVGIGPQTEDLFGAELNLKVGNLPWMTLTGKYGISQYVASKGANIGIPQSNGNMAAGGLKIDNSTGFKITGGLEYFWVTPNYDPFVAQIPVPTTVFSGPQSLIRWNSFPFPSAYGPPYTTVVGGLMGLSMTGTTAGGGDIYYNLHDSSRYPNNRTGGRANLNWNFGDGNVGGLFEYMQQSTISALPTEFQPGFYEPIFVALPSANVGAGATALTQPSAFGIGGGTIAKGIVQVWNGNANYTLPFFKDLTIDGLYTDSRIKRAEPDFNNINLHFVNWRAGLTYKPTTKWTLMGGYDVLQSIDQGDYLMPASNQFAVPVQITTAAGTATFNPGATVPSNYLFTQRGPYFGVNYGFANNASAWMMFNVFSMSDNTNLGYSGFAGTQVSSGMQFQF